jgi:hypothetical protein
MGWPYQVRKTSIESGARDSWAGGIAREGRTIPPDYGPSDQGRAATGPVCSIVLPVALDVLEK